MAHWFHRNPLKATAPQDFNLKMVSHDVEAIKVSDDAHRAAFSTHLLGKLDYLQIRPIPA